ncbi:MAG TPA: hypothetical protein VLE47_00300 [Candidatus Saccharimonadales bacterium]|nr:hypothetical protein [Candidatus Saccharimonadales bacterium]
MSKFSPTAAISFGWNSFTKNVGFLILVTLIPLGFSLVSFTLIALIDYLVGKSLAGFVNILLVPAFYYFSFVIALGTIKAILNLLDKGQGDLSDLLIYTKNFMMLLNYLFASILAGLIILGGFILFIIPGIYFSIRLSQFTYFLIDKNLGPVDAIKASWEATKASMLNLMVFGFLSFLVILAGAILFGIGLLVAAPIVTVATVYVYRQLAGASQIQTQDAPSPVQPVVPVATPPAAG